MDTSELKRILEEKPHLKVESDYVNDILRREIFSRLYAPFNHLSKERQHEIMHAVRRCESMLRSKRKILAEDREKATYGF